MVFNTGTFFMIATFMASAMSAGTSSVLTTSTGTSITAASSVSAATNSAAGTGTSTATSTALTSSPTIVKNIQYYGVPFTGFGDSDKDLWGVAVVNIADEPRPLVQQLYEILVSNSTYLPSSGFTECDETPNVLADAFSDTSAGLITYPSLEGLSPMEEPKLIIGPNSPLEIELEFPQKCSSIYVLETVPFGINLGHFGVWNGSMTFSGSYDSNRIASKAWSLVPETANGNSTFLQNGTQDVSVTINSNALVATLDINANSIALPSSISCNNLVITFAGLNTTQSLDITIPSNLTARCSSSGSAGVILGRPFFQAAYAYIDETGQIFLTAANQYSLTVIPEPFQADATLEIPASPTPLWTAAPTGKSAAPQMKLNRALLGLLVLGMMVL